MDDLTPIVWSAEFSVGVPEFDRQHHQIIDVINRMLASRETSPHSETVSDALDELSRFADRHFKAEEAFLTERNYSALEEQKASHQLFRRRTLELCQMALEHTSSTPSELLAFVRGWWVRHILEADRRYARELGLLPT
jgi:hemerythrin-like metal-binding protein